MLLDEVSSVIRVTWYSDRYRYPIMEIHSGISIIYFPAASNILVTGAGCNCELG
jgi:hypothetical protein